MRNEVCDTNVTPRYAQPNRDRPTDTAGKETIECRLFRLQNHDA